MKGGAFRREWRRRQRERTTRVGCLKLAEGIFFYEVLCMRARMSRKWYAAFAMRIWCKRQWFVSGFAWVRVVEVRSRGLVAQPL